MTREEEITLILKTQILDKNINDRAEALDVICNYLCSTYPGKQLEPNLERLGLKTTTDVKKIINWFFVKKNYL